VALEVSVGDPIGWRIPAVAISAVLALVVVADWSVVSSCWLCDLDT
jgi:acid phosphatase family membrane protein YuiD